MAEEKTVSGSAALASPPRVITIAATEQPQDLKLRVAAYCRVSSDSEDQLNSFAAQNHYYTALITGKENWELVDVYADRGITGTSAEKREDFQRLMADCRRGLIDRVLAKSISRFARNTKECLEALRELKLLGVGVQFEKEGIDTSMMSSEFMTTFFATFAQEESVSISNNMRWSYEKRMKAGTFNTCKNPFGYQLHNGTLEVYEPEAKIIRLIFKQFLAGYSCEDIAHQITELSISTRDDRERWQFSTISYVLRNERYVGDSLLQKWYTTDSLPHQKRRNLGERPQYLVQSSHPAIIDSETFQAVQKLIQQRAERVTTVKVITPFNKSIYCEHCGKVFRRKTCRSNVYWVCCTHFKNKSACPIRQIPESEIEQAFLRLHYNLKHHDILGQLLKDLQTMRDRKMLWAPDVVELNKRISQLSSQNQTLAELKQQGLVDSDIFIAQANKLAEQLRALKLQKERLVSSTADDAIDRTQELIDVLEAGPDCLDVFDGELFSELVERVIVESNTQLRFRLKNGLELPETMERTVR